MSTPVQTSITASSEEGPHFEVLDRVRNIPVIHSAIEKTGSTYSYIKESHHLINWALSHAEAGVHFAASAATPIAAPLAKKLEGPINAVDQKLCEGLDIVEQNVPIVKKPPQEIYEAAKNVMSTSLQPTIEKLLAAKESATQQASTLKDISIAKANEILSTKYGTKAVEGVDNTSVIVNRLLDHYFPGVEPEETVPAPVSADENKVLHAVQTIGQLSTKTAGRVYHSVAAQLKTIKKEDVSNYMNSVVSILHLTNFLNMDQKAALEQDVGTSETPNEESEQSEVKKDIIAK